MKEETLMWILGGLASMGIIVTGWLASSIGKVADRLERISDSVSDLDKRVAIYFSELEHVKADRRECREVEKEELNALRSFKRAFEKGEV